MKNIYFNNAATSYPKPKEVIVAVTLCLKNLPISPGRSGMKGNCPINICRSLIARLLDVENSSNIALCGNATAALNTAVWGLPLKPKDRIIVTAAEHNSLLRPVFHRAKAQGLSVEVIPVDSQGRPLFQAFKDCIQAGGVKLTALNHSSNVTGAVTDPTPFFQLAKKAGAFTLLDASQTMGAVPVNAGSMYADMIAWTGHKSLLGPQGTGGLYVSESIKLDPFVTGGTGVRSDLLYQPEDMPMRLESGTPNIAAFAGLAAALELKKSYKSNGKALRLIQQLEDGLKSINKVKLIEVQGERTPILSFLLEGWDVDEAGYVLHESFGIICRTGLHCAPLIHKYINSSSKGCIRFSLSDFNTEEETEYAVKSIKQMVNL